MRRTALTLEGWLAGWSAAERAALSQLWGIAVHASQAAGVLAAAMMQPDAVARVVAELDADARSALERVARSGGSIAAHTLEQEYGAIGSAAEYLNPRSFLVARGTPLQPLEQLFALALLRPQRAGRVRLYEVPHELLPLLPFTPRYAPIAELAPYAASFDHARADLTRIDDQILTLLALAYEGQLVCVADGGLNKASIVRLARAWGVQTLDMRMVMREAQWPYAGFLRGALMGAGALRLDAERRLRVTRAALDWLRGARGDRTARLLAGWIDSSWDELAGVGIFLRHAGEGERQAARRALLGLLMHMPPGRWVECDELVAAIRRVAPDFARRDGRYDTLGARRRGGGSLDGYAGWPAVDGHLIRVVLTQPLYWLGIVEIGRCGDEAVAACMTEAGAALLAGAREDEAPAADHVIVGGNFEVLAPPGSSLYARFQLGRFAERAGGERAPVYRLTRRRVQQALDRGATVDDLLAFLAEASADGVPPHVATALRDWGERRGGVALRSAVLIESDDSVILEAIRRDGRLGLADAAPLPGAGIVVTEHAAVDVAARLRSAGYLVSGVAKPDVPLRERDLAVLRVGLEFYARAAEMLGFESDASGALRRRLAGLLTPQQIEATDDLARAALAHLDARVVHDAAIDG
jgi:hypothetical protein